MSDPVQLALIALIATIIPSILTYLSLRKAKDVETKVDLVDKKVATVETNIETGDKKLDKIGVSTDGRLTEVTAELKVLREMEMHRSTLAAEQLKLMQDMMMRMAEKPDSATLKQTTPTPPTPPDVTPIVDAVTIGMEESLKNMTVETINAEKIVVPEVPEVPKVPKPKVTK